MGLFNKQKPPASPSETSRRRPEPTNPQTRRTQTFSYYAQRSTPADGTTSGRENSPREPFELSASARSWQVSRRTLMVAISAALIIGIFLSVLSGSPKIVRLTANGGGYFMQDPAVYQQAAARSFSNSIFNKNKLTIDTAKISQDLTNNFPEIHTARVTTPLFGTRPVIYLEPYQPSFVLTTTDSKAYVLDVTGRALTTTSQVPNLGQLSLPTVQDKSGLEVKLGTRVLPEATVQFIRQVVGILSSAKVGYQSLELPPASSELDVFISGTPYFVKFNLQADSRLQAGTFLAAKQRWDREHSVPTQYVDVRVGGRVYYR